MNAIPRILLVGDPIPPEILKLFQSQNFPVIAQPLSGSNISNVTQSQIIVLFPSEGNSPQALALCRRWRLELGDQYVPIIWLQESSQLNSLALESGADICLSRNVPIDFLLAQVKALLRAQHIHDRLLFRANESNQINLRLQQAYQQIDNDLELTRRIHRGFLPKTLPEVDGTRFAVCYRPRSRIGGDFYDVLRLDENHIGFYVADAMGRGLPASSLLSIFVKRALYLKEIGKEGYRLVPPAEVLNRLNHDLVALAMPEPPFVTMIYGILDTKNGTLRFSRAAHPHPLLVPAEGEVEYWYSAGSLLGIFESDYPEHEKTLKPGDKLVITTDGINPPNAGGSGSSNDRLLESTRKHRALPLQQFVDQVARDLLEVSRHPDDFTILALEYN
ncbi:PP2C family protein-serine/threonine phosphatase [Telmatocola sphagniphila]|uniref:PP2C family protein-serine/threonine phosphatase n=1 Tax=Telmatocola sphagniphila TaxID=1123043 RepID=A0A8E6B8B0_9BACT|nr:PP2C family protein-serine/threonine phosphatase [Telmatocola sphagniphila]QVL33114.1 PP2C family protein-serine/threonine phosphatase [Telmatocola sphagniphila]